MPAASRWKCSQEVIEPARDDPVAQDLLLAVDVVEEHLQRLDALRDATLEPRPLGRRDHPRHQVQRERSLLAGQREGDALVDERAAERLGPRRQLGGVRRGKLGEDALVRPADVALGVEHLVEGLRVAARRCCTRRRCRRDVWTRRRPCARIGRHLAGRVRRLTLDMLPHASSFGRPVARSLWGFTRRAGNLNPRCPRVGRPRNLWSTPKLTFRRN